MSESCTGLFDVALEHLATDLLLDALVAEQDPEGRKLIVAEFKRRSASGDEGVGQ
jgi:hypothetical protein